MFTPFIHALPYVALASAIAQSQSPSPSQAWSLGVPICAAVEIDVHDCRRICPTGWGQRAFPIRQLPIAELAVCLSPATPASVPSAHASKRTVLGHCYDGSQDRCL